jgi:hypothetical protein
MSELALKDFDILSDAEKAEALALLKNTTSLKSKTNAKVTS